MSTCAIELRDAVNRVLVKPEFNELLLFVTQEGYVFRTWELVADSVIQSIEPTPDDVDYIITASIAGRNYYNVPGLEGKRYRLYRDGLLLSRTFWQPLDAGGWKLLKEGDLLIEDQTFTIQFY